tara:strand:+ start:280 stop:465 length:186 start_codon:yes stop_codon:yes gene_type:complete
MVKRENINTTKHAHITMNIRVGRTVGRTVINPKHNEAISADNTVDSARYFISLLHKKEERE